MKKNVINYFLVFVILFFSLFFSSCINSLLDESQDDSLPSLTFDNSDYVTIRGSINPEINNRSVFPSLPEIQSAHPFKYKITVKNGTETLVTKENTFTSWDNLSYEIAAPKGTSRKIDIDIKNNAGDTIFTGNSEEFNIDGTTPTNIIDITVRPEKTNRGDFLLYFKNDSSKKLYIKITKSGNTNTFGTYSLVANTQGYWDTTGIQSGPYTLIFDFYENNASGQHLYSCEQVINVYDNLNSNDLVKNGDETYIKEITVDGKQVNAICIDDNLINSYQQTIVYVGTLPSGATANGSYFAPYTRLSNALDALENLPDNTTYKIYLTSDIQFYNDFQDKMDNITNKTVEISSVGSNKYKISYFDIIGNVSENHPNCNIIFKNLELEYNDNNEDNVLNIYDVGSVTFEDCIVRQKVILNYSTRNFKLKGNCSFIKGIDLSKEDNNNPHTYPKITLESVVKPVTRIGGFVAKVNVASGQDDLTNVFTNSNDEKLKKSVSYFNIVPSGSSTEQKIFINTGNTTTQVPISQVKFVADSNPQTNGLGVAGDPLGTGDGSMSNPYCSVSAAIDALLNTSQAKYIYIAGSVTQSFPNTEINLDSTSTWYFMGWNGVELNESTQNIDTITNSYSNPNSLFQITGTNANLYFLNLKIEGANTNQGTNTTDNKQVGSAIYLKDKQTESEKNKVTLKNVWITNCKTKDYGGAIYVGKNNELTTENCYFGNLSDADTNRIESTTVSGGAIYSKGVLDLNNTSFRGFSSNEGGAIYNANNTVDTQSINNCYFSNNSSNSSGGAIYSLGPLGITNTTIKNCSTSELGRGGAIYSQGSLVITNSTIESCKAANGGGLYLYDINSSITLDEYSKITNCIAVYGAGIYMDENTGNIIMKYGSRVSSPSQNNDIFITGNGSTQTIQLDNYFANSYNGTNSKMKIGFYSRITATPLIEKYETTISKQNFIKFLSYFELDTTTGNLYELITTDDLVNDLGYVYLKANP